MTTIRVSRKMSDGNYGSAEASLEVELNEGGNVEDGFAKAQGLVDAHVSAVLNGQGDTPSSTVQTPTPTDATEFLAAEGIAEDTAAAVAEVFPDATPASAGIAVAEKMDPDTWADYYVSLGDGGGRRTAEQTKAALERLASHPGEFWDNRADIESGKSHPKAPHFKWGKGGSEQASKRDDVDVAIWPKK